MFEHTIFSKNNETRERAERIQLRRNARDDSFRNSLRWPMHIINPVGKTKLSHSNIVHYSLITWRVKQTTPRKWPPPTERPYQRHRKVGKSFPEKESFSASLEPSKTPEATSDNNVIPLNLFGVANQMWSVCAFLCNIQDPVLTSWHSRKH